MPRCDRLHRGLASMAVSECKTPLNMAVISFTKKWSQNDRRMAMSFSDHFIRAARVRIIFRTEMENLIVSKTFSDLQHIHRRKRHCISQHLRHQEL